VRGFTRGCNRRLTLSILLVQICLESTSAATTTTTVSSATATAAAAAAVSAIPSTVTVVMMVATSTIVDASGGHYGHVAGAYSPATISGGSGTVGRSRSLDL
jgi:hypothetical protein